MVPLFYGACKRWLVLGIPGADDLKRRDAMWCMEHGRGKTVQFRRWLGSPEAGFRSSLKQRNDS